MYSRKFSLQDLLALAITIFLSQPVTVLADSRFGVRGLDLGPKKLNNACDIVNESGIGWYRASLFWDAIVDAEGQFDWTKFDKRIKRVLNQGIEVLVTIRSVHETFAPGSGKYTGGGKTRKRSAPPAPEYLDMYRSFVNQAVERYDGDGTSDADFITSRKAVKHWQIENEPGRLPGQGSNYWNGDEVDFANLHAVAYDEIKTADSHAKVILAGFTHIALMYCKRNDNNCFPYNAMTLIEELGSDFDIFDYHLFKDYKAVTKFDKAAESLIREYKDIFYADNPSERKGRLTWVTATGIDQKDMDPNYTSEAYNRFVAKDIVRRFTTLFRRKVKKVFWFRFCDDKKAVWKDPMTPRTFEKFRGLVEQYSDETETFPQKPVFYTLRLLTEKAAGRSEVIKVTDGIAPDVWMFQYGEAPGQMYVAWYDDGSVPVSPTLTSIPVPWAEALITHVITEPDVTEPEVEIGVSVGGFLEITLDDGPVLGRISRHHTALATPAAKSLWNPMSKITFSMPSSKFRSA